MNSDDQTAGLNSSIRILVMGLWLHSSTELWTLDFRLKIMTSNNEMT